MFNRKEFNERIQQEFSELKNLTNHLEKQDIFDMAHEIDFKCNLAEHLQNEELVNDELAEKLNNIENGILDFVFDIHLSSYTDLSFEVIDNALEEFTALYDEEIGEEKFTDEE